MLRASKRRLNCRLHWLSMLWFLPVLQGTYQGYKSIKATILSSLIFSPRLDSPSGLDLLVFEVSRTHSDTLHSVGLSPEEWLVRRRDLYLTTNNTHNRQTSKPPAGFDTTIPADERPRNDALDPTAAFIGLLPRVQLIIQQWPSHSNPYSLAVRVTYHCVQWIHKQRCVWDSTVLSSDWILQPYFQLAILQVFPSLCLTIM